MDNSVLKINKNNKFIEITTERLLLSPHGIRYLESVYEYTSDIDNTRFMVNLPNNSIDEAREYLDHVEEEWQKEKPLLYEFAIIYEGNQVGTVGIDVDEERTYAEFGWCLNKRYWRLGITYEAAAAVLDFAVNELGIKHFIAHCDAENAASYGLMEKLGMKRVKKYGGRFNKSSTEERMELLYELYVIE